MIWVTKICNLYKLGTPSKKFSGEHLLWHEAYFIINKNISKILHDRIKKLLPVIISEKQVGFVQGRSIIENILVVQEFVSKIIKRGNLPNMVIKLDIMKAYDIVDWLYLTKVLRKLGFNETIIDMVYKLVGGNWYSILLNGQP